MTHKLTIGHLFPEILNLYGDKGNIASLTNRLTWRGLEAEVLEIKKSDPIDFTKMDMIYLGGGDHNAHKLVCECLLPYKEDLLAYIENGGVMLATCGGFEVLGKCFEAQGTIEPALGILDISVTSGRSRLIGNVVIESNVTGQLQQFVGFENHAGRMHIGTYEPFGRVLVGHGNNGADKTCGLVYKNLLCTYLHGPILPKNPVLTDYLLAKSLQSKYGKDIKLSELDDVAEKAAHDYAVKRFLQQ